MLGLREENLLFVALHYMVATSLNGLGKDLGEKMAKGPGSGVIMNIEEFCCTKRWAVGGRGDKFRAVARDKVKEYKAAE